MSCEYCTNHEPIWSGDGYFQVDNRIAVMLDGECRTESIMRYCAEDRVFSVDVEIEDHIVINYCPMCGACLTEGLR